ncbi:MFS transporter [Micromonospora sp. NPDC007230]|uniref:MFS transporter n=1 Tax=Micromonospora sp. NPDC007230 TaxID=3364237 RepID=UPI0036B4CB51
MSTYHALFRHRGYLAFWLGQVTSVIGNGIRLVALPALILQSHSGKTYAYVLAADAFFSVVLMLLGGAFADRHSRTGLMALSDVIRAIAVLGYLTFGPQSALAPLLLCAALAGTGSALFQPAHRAALPQIVPAELRQKANSLDGATNSLGLAAGAGLGGVLVASVGPRWALLFDVATFMVSLLTLLWIRLPGVAAPSVKAASPSIFAEIKEGAREVRRRAWVWTIMLQGTLQLLLVFAPYSVLVPVASADRYGYVAYGWISASGSLGMIIGSALAGRVTTARPGLWAMNALTPAALFVWCLAVDVPLAVFCVCAFLGWVGIGIFVVFWFTALQKEFPQEVQGRVFALESVVTFGLNPVAFALTPLVADRVGLTAFAAIAVAMLIASNYVVLLVPGAITLSTPTAVKEPAESNAAELTT